MNWDDFKIAIAVMQTGTYLAAAARLGVDETTVSRRIARLEKALGYALFEAVDGVRQPTQRGSEAMLHAVQMSNQAAKISCLVESSDRPAATFRLATTDSIAVELLSPALPALLEAHPELSVELHASTENVNFSRWEADFAIRLRKPEKGDFLIAKLADLRFYLFMPKQSKEPLICAYPEALDSTPESQFLKASSKLPRARGTSKNLLVIKRMILTGMAGGILPSFMCADLMDDERFDITRLDCTREVWLLIQPHLASDALARAVIDWIKQRFAFANL